MDLIIHLKMTIVKLLFFLNGIFMWEKRYVAVRNSALWLYFDYNQ